MADFQPCYFPILDGNLDSSTTWHSIDVPLHGVVDLHSKGEQLGVPPASFLQMAWAVVLRCYLGNSSIFFGCAGLEKMTDWKEGDCDLTCCRVVLEEDYTVLKLLKAMKGHSPTGFVSERTGSVIKPIEDGLVKVSSFNTALLYQTIESECSAFALDFSIATTTQKVSNVS